MRLVITGGTGLVGSALVEHFLALGHQVAVLSRRPDRARLPSVVDVIAWQPETTEDHPPWWSTVADSDGVIHLAGASIASGRWDEEQKRRIRDSRVRGTRALVEAIAAAPHPPRMLVSGSATGYYGPHGDEPLTEQSPPGTDFLAEVCQAWEDEAALATRSGVRVVCLRTGLVLSTEGGALPQIMAPFRRGVGGPLGSGRQWMSWIHRRDLVDLIAFLVESEQAEGPVNAVTPHPVTNKEFADVLGGVLHRPAWLPVPSFVLEWMAGEMAQALLLQGQRVLPEQAETLGFQFRFGIVREALHDLLG